MWRALFDDLRRTQFHDCDGAEAACVVPVSDRLVTRVVSQSRMLNQSPLASVDVRANGDDEMTVHLRLKQPSFLPPFAVRLRIEQQPELPERPVVVLRLLSQGLAVLAAPAARLFSVLPSGITVDGDRIRVRIEPLLPNQIARDLFSRLTVLEVHVVPDRFVVTVRGVLNATGPHAGSQ